MGQPRLNLNKWTVWWERQAPCTSHYSNWPLELPGQPVTVTVSLQLQVSMCFQRSSRTPGPLKVTTLRCLETLGSTHPEERNTQLHRPETLETRELHSLKTPIKIPLWGCLASWRCHNMSISKRLKPPLFELAPRHLSCGTDTRLCPLPLKVFREIPPRFRNVDAEYRLPQEYWDTLRTNPQLIYYSVRMGAPRPTPPPPKPWSLWPSWHHCF
jgi:hypothetical protein